MRKVRQAVLALACGVLLLGSALPAAAGSASTAAAATSCAVIVKNGGFENTPLGADWTQGGNGGVQLIDQFRVRSGRYSAHLGGTNNTDHTISQSMTLPRRPVILTFWWEQWTQESAPGTLADYLAVNLVVNGQTREIARLGVDPDRPPWERLSFDLSAYAGQTVQLQFAAHNDATNPTDFFVDDVSIPGCRAYLPNTGR